MHLIFIWTLSNQVDAFNKYHTIKPTTLIQQNKLISCDV